MDGQAKGLDLGGYELYAERGRRRFRAVVGSVVAGLLGAIYVPWAFVATRSLSSGAAATISLLAGIFFLAIWQGLLTRLTNPYDSGVPTAEGRRATLRGLSTAAVSIVALLVAMACSFYLEGFIQSDGILGTALLVIAMGASLVRALLFRASRSRFHP